MRRTQVVGQVMTPAGLVSDGLVAVVDGTIAYVGPRDAYDVDGAGVDTEIIRPPEQGVVLPGLIDLHDHGGGGASFGDTDPGCFATAAAQHSGHGTTTLVASIVTDAPDRMLAAVAAAADAADAGTIMGVHLEGPFLATARCGAQDPRHLLDPDAGLTRELLGAGRGHVRVMTLAPELTGADAVARVLLGHGVVPAVGHTEAGADVVRRTLAETRAALGRPGLVTHLFNGMPPLHHRHPGPVAGALSAAARGDAVVELVADGVHLDDDTVRMVFDLLGPHRIALVTDAMAATGMPDGSYDLGPQRVHVRGAVARLGPGDDAPLAGGTTHLLDVVRRCVLAGIDLADAVTAASLTPATVLGVVGDVGVLDRGHRADLLVTDADLRPVRVMRAGEWVT